MDPELYGYSEKTAKEAASQVLTVNIRVTADNGRTGVRLEKFSIFQFMLIFFE
tara:strand:- start:291 stop:449 length:159 start_codon:yes stop_codon:yes gene_type:complete